MTKQPGTYMGSLIMELNQKRSIEIMRADLYKKHSINRD